MLEGLILALIILLPLGLITLSTGRKALRGRGRSRAAPLSDMHDPNAVESLNDFVAMVGLGQAPPRFAPPPRGDATYDIDDKHIVVTEDEIS